MKYISIHNSRDKKICQDNITIPEPSIVDIFKEIGNEHLDIFLKNSYQTDKTTFDKNIIPSSSL